jgi:hypothetical protein
MLMSMQPKSSASPVTTFRNLTLPEPLAGIAATEKKPPAGHLDLLEEDVACLSFEQALRSKSRFKPPPPSTEPEPNSAAVAPRSQRLMDPGPNSPDSI